MYPQYPTFECERIPVKQIIKELYITPQQQCAFSIAKNYSQIQQRSQRTKIIQTTTNNLIADKDDLQQSLLASSLSLTINGDDKIEQQPQNENQILQSFIQLIYHYPEIIYYLSYLNNSHVQRIAMLSSVVGLYKEGQILFDQQNIQLHLADGDKFVSSDFMRSPITRLVYTSIIKSLLTTQTVADWPQLNFLNIKTFTKGDSLLQDVIYSFVDQQDCKQYSKSILQELVQKIFTEKQEDNNYISYLNQDYIDYYVGQFIQAVMSSFSQLPSTIKFILKLGKFAIQNFVINLMTKENINEYGNKFKYYAEIFYEVGVLSYQNKVKLVINELMTRFTAFVVFGIFIRAALNNPVSYGLLSIEQTNDESIETVLSLLSLVGDLCTDVFYNSRMETTIFLDSIDTRMQYGQELVEIRNHVVNKYRSLIASANPNDFAQDLTEEEINILNQEIFDTNLQLYSEKKLWISIGQLQLLLLYFENNYEFLLKNCRISIQNQQLINKCARQDITIQMYNKTIYFVQQFHKILQASQLTSYQLVNSILQSIQCENGIYVCQLLPLLQNQQEMSQIENDHFYDQYYAIKDIIDQNYQLEDNYNQIQSLIEQKVGKEQYNEQISDYNNQVTRITKQVQKDDQLLTELCQQIEQSQQKQDYLIEQLNIYLTYRKLDEVNQTLKQQLQERILKPFNDMVTSQLQFNQALNATAVVNADMTFDQLLYNSEKILNKLYSNKQQQEPGIIDEIYEQYVQNDQVDSYIVQQLQ